MKKKTNKHNKQISIDFQILWKLINPFSTSFSLMTFYIKFFYLKIYFSGSINYKLINYVLKFKKNYQTKLKFIFKSMFNITFNGNKEVKLIFPKKLFKCSKIKLHQKVNFHRRSGGGRWPCPIDLAHCIHRQKSAAFKASIWFYY